MFLRWDAVVRHRLHKLIGCAQLYLQQFLYIQKLVTTFANEQRLEFVLHDDSSLPSIAEQLQRFANASIIIGPHGAGMVNIIASKRRTCLIEFSPTDPNIS